MFKHLLLPTFTINGIGLNSKSAVHGGELSTTSSTKVLKWPFVEEIYSHLFQNVVTVDDLFV